MKILFLGLIAAMLIVLAGYAKSKECRIEPVEQSIEKRKLMMVTGNSVFKYTKKEKIKDEDMIAMFMEPTNDKKMIELYLIILEGKVRLLFGVAYSYIYRRRYYKVFACHFIKGKIINFGDEVYLIQRNFCGEWSFRYTFCRCNVE